MNDTISLILNYVLGGGLLSVLTVLLFYTSKRRKEAAEANKAEQNVESVAIQNMRESAVEWKEIAEAREVKINTKDLVIDRLYAEKNDDRKEIHRLATETSTLQLELQAAQFKACSKRGCSDREPQTGF